MIVKTILKKQDPIKIAQAQKLMVRELEEHDGVGNYIAFVDEGEESYDVNILLKGDDVSAHSCDCKRKDSYCVHQLAVILALSSSASSKNPPSGAKKFVAKSKMKESEQLLLSIDPLDIKDWLIELFKTNKDIELQFVLKFSKHDHVYQSKDISKMLNDVVISVIGKRKKIDAAEVKKIVQLWDKSMIPVWEFIQLNITKKDILILWTALINSLYDFQYKYNYGGTRVRTFLVGCYEKLGIAFSSVHSDIQWQSHFYWLWDEMWREGGNLIGILDPIKIMYTHLSEQRKVIFASRAKKQLEDFLDEGVIFPVEIDDFFLDVMIDANLLGDILSYFQPKPWENKFNLKFIYALKEIEPQIAIDFCIKIIGQNVKLDYNLPYLDVLEELFVKFNNLDGLAGIKMDKFGFYPNIADFIFIMEHVDDAEIKNRFRSNVLARYRNSLNDPLYVDVYFGILAYEKNYKKMLEVIDYNICAYALLKYWDLIYAYDKMKFIKAISNNFHIQYDTDMDEVDLLIDKIIESYDHELLRLLFKPDSRSTYLRTLKGHLFNRLEQKN